MKILVVDDERTVRLYLEAVLKGHEVDSVATGLEAQEKLKKNKYDLVIIDVLLGNMNGYSLYSYIRNILNLDTKVVMYSALPKEKGIDVPYAQKGNPDQILKMLSKITSNKNYNYDDL